MTIGIDLSNKNGSVTINVGDSFKIGGSIEEALSYLAERFAASTDVVPANENVRVLEPGWKYSDLFDEGETVVYQDIEDEAE